MFAHIKINLQGAIKCISCCKDYDDDNTESTRSSERPLLDRSPPFTPLDTRPTLPSPIMPPKKPRTYGSKKSTVAPGSAVIFGSAAASEATVESVASLLADSHLDEVVSECAESEASDHDLPFVLSTSTIADHSALAANSSSKPKKKVSKAPAQASTPDPVLAGLESLINAHQIDTGNPINVLDWASILPHGSSISKIAEASYAEVYRVTTSAGSSIIKIMQLQVPADPTSYEIETASAVENVVSEIRIMNALTEVPGYVTFKGTYIVQGPPPKNIVAAYNAHLETRDEEEGSYFPHPATAFNASSTFLVLELGDAGNVLEDVLIQHIDQVWDVFLGVVMALSRAEITNQFEHRDLHENNICVRVSSSSLPVRPASTSSSSSASGLQFGFSGLQVTLIDYGLSRACLESGETIYKNLESDLALFHSVSSGIPGIQFDSYRRMRTHMLTGTHTMNPPAWHDEKSLPSLIKTPWKAFMPYTNVLWIRYILTYLISSYKSTVCPTPASARRDPDLALFTTQTRELTKRLNVKTKISNGAFTSAEEVLAFVVASGWVSEQQLEQYGVDESTLCEVSELIESEDEDSDSETGSSDSDEEEEDDDDDA